MKKTDRLKKNCAILLLYTIIAGCNAPKSNLETFNRLLLAPGYEQSFIFARSRIGKNEKPKAEDLLWTLQLGSVERLRQNHHQSTVYFDKAEEMLNFYDHQNEITSTLASTAAGDNVVPYTGQEYDGIMVNTYKALNFMITGQDELARVEFNRALDRQRRAKEMFAREIEQLNNQIKEKEGKNPNLRKSIENPQVKQLIGEEYPCLYEFEAYPDFVNPFTTYLAGIYFNLIGDYSKAIDLLKESYGMVQTNSYIADDLAAAEQILQCGGQLSNTIWVIFENGLGPVKEEFRIDIPIFLVTDKVKYVGIALPRLIFREQAYPYLIVKTKTSSCKTQIVADMDRVIQTEFGKDFGDILTRAIISATAKAAAQYVLAKQDSFEGSIASALVGLYSYATTAADVRTWTTLPKDFQVTRLNIPENRDITIIPPAGVPLNIKIPDCSNAIVYVRIPFETAEPVYDIITY
ncbi:MAG: hypothetical protein JXB29_09040 [Sedimentisphaerales bacterium]|nr:hypothetical protein [Sedimentisphaerales bacterium]